MKAIKLVPALLLSAMLVACGSSDKGAELPQPSVLSSSSEASSASSVVSSSSQQSSSSDPALEVAWNIYDGNDSPFATGVIQLGDGGNTEFILGGNEGGLDATYFAIVGDGTVNLDSSAEPAHQHFAQLDNVVAADGEYPKYFTLIAGITGPSEPSRVLDIEIAMADVDAAGSRLKAIIRADGGNTGVQLERATNGGATSDDSVNSYDLDMLDVFRVYHIAIELTSATHGNVTVYADGSDEPLPNLELVDEEMRPTANNGDNFLRIGDTGGSAYQANIDWVIWTNEAAYTPSELTGSLPANIGCINGYGATSCGDEGSSSSAPPDLGTPDFDFETDAVGSYPAGFNSSIEQLVQVSNVQARTGTQSVALYRMNVGENTNLRKIHEAADTGRFQVSLFIPSNIPEGVNTYVTLWDSGWTAVNNRVADLVVGYNGVLQNRTRSENPGTAQGALAAIEDVTFELGQWNDFEMSWTNISTTGEYTLSINGNVIGTFEAEHVGRIPNRFEIKYGASNHAADPAIPMFVDSIFAF